MLIGAPKEISPGEARVAMTPESAKALMKLGYECQIETMAGSSARFQDADYDCKYFHNHCIKHILKNDISL